MRRKISQKVEDQTVFVVEGYRRFADAFVKLAQSIVTVGRVDLAPCHSQLTVGLASVLTRLTFDIEEL